MTDFDLAAWLDGTPELPPIVQAGAEVLRRAAKEVPRELFAHPALRELVRRMIEVMRAAPGVGLAAPQIGVPLRVFVAEDREELLARVPEADRARKGRVPLALTVAVNPVVASLGEARATFYEGCLSVRGYGALVERRRRVRLKAKDAEGGAFVVEKEGWPARIFQHEFDHLGGTLYVDRMIPRSLSADAALPRWALGPPEEALRALVDPEK